MLPDTCPERGCPGDHGYTYARGCDSTCPKNRANLFTEADLDDLITRGIIAMPNCTRHNRAACHDPACRRELRDRAAEAHDDNTGQVGIDNQGDLTIGIGGGLAIDTSDGSLAVDLGGFSVDTDGQ